MKIVAIIPARGGSKGIVHKNVLPYKGTNLLNVAVQQAKEATMIGRVFVSTDNHDYANIAMDAGAEVIRRPPELAEDMVPDLPVMQHALDWVEMEYGYLADIVVHLRVTYPTRTIENIHTAINLLIQNELATSVRSVALAKECPYKMWTKETGKYLNPLIKSDARYSDIKELQSACRQNFPKVYYQNACVEVIRGSVIRGGSICGKYILPYFMRKNEDIDTYEDYRNLLIGESNAC